MAHRSPNQPVKTMRHLALILALLPFPALAEMPTWWRPGAIWAGEGVQSDGPEWSVEITLGTDGATILYPSIPCGGTLDVIASGPDEITLRETITENTFACIDGGTLRLRVEAGGSLLFDWNDPVTGLTATAILAPPVS
jgi:hypothetical protein